MLAMTNGRCRMHGGTSPGAPAGNKNALKHGLYTAEAIAWAERHFEPGTAHENSCTCRQMIELPDGRFAVEVAEGVRIATLTRAVFPKPQPWAG